MKIETIENILNFLKEKEDKELPNKWFDFIKKLELAKEIENHPDGTQYRYEGTLNLINTNIKKLPNDLYVNGGLYLGGLPIKELPNNLHVTYELSLYNCKQITELPNNLHVGLNLFIRNTPLAKKYTDEEIYEIIASTGGQIKGIIR